MTDNEIIERLKENAEYDCNKCCYYDEWCNGTTSRCNVVIARNALELIRKQQAEIKCLKDEICDIDTVNRNLIKEKAEAIKEFAARLKANRPHLNTGEQVFYIRPEAVDEIVKEMVGAGDDKV